MKFKCQLASLLRVFCLKLAFAFLFFLTPLLMAGSGSALSFSGALPSLGQGVNVDQKLLVGIVVTTNAFDGRDSFRDATFLKSDFKFAESIPSFRFGEGGVFTLRLGGGGTDHTILEPSGATSFNSELLQVDGHKYFVLYVLATRVLNVDGESIAFNGNIEDFFNGIGRDYQFKPDLVLRLNAIPYTYKTELAETVYSVQASDFLANPLTFASLVTVNAYMNVAQTSFYYDSFIHQFGVGTASPAYDLDVQGTMNVKGDIKLNGVSIIDPYFSENDVGGETFVTLNEQFSKLALLRPRSSSFLPFLPYDLSVQGAVNVSGSLFLNDESFVFSFYNRWVSGNRGEGTPGFQNVFYTSRDVGVLTEPNEALDIAGGLKLTSVNVDEVGIHAGSIRFGEPDDSGLGFYGFMPVGGEVVSTSLHLLSGEGEEHQLAYWKKASELMFSSDVYAYQGFLGFSVLPQVPLHFDLNDEGMSFLRFTGRSDVAGDLGVTMNRSGRLLVGVEESFNDAYRLEVVSLNSEGFYIDSTPLQYYLLRQSRFSTLNNGVLYYDPISNPDKLFLSVADEPSASFYLDSNRNVTGTALFLGSSSDQNRFDFPAFRFSSGLEGNYTYYEWRAGDLAEHIWSDSHIFTFDLLHQQETMLAFLSENDDPRVGFNQDYPSANFTLKGDSVLVEEGNTTLANFLPPDVGAYFYFFPYHFEENVTNFQSLLFLRAGSFDVGSHEVLPLPFSYAMGRNHKAAAMYTSVLGGEGHTVEREASQAMPAQYTTLLGGQDNVARGAYSLLMGYMIRDSYGEGAFLWQSFGGLQTSLNTTQGGQFLVNNVRNVNFNVNSGGADSLMTLGSIRTTSLSFLGDDRIGDLAFQSISSLDKSGAPMTTFTQEYASRFLWLFLVSHNVIDQHGYVVDRDFFLDPTHAELSRTFSRDLNNENKVFVPGVNDTSDTDIERKRTMWPERLRHTPELDYLLSQANSLQYFDGDPFLNGGNAVGEQGALLTVTRNLTLLLYRLSGHDYLRAYSNGGVSRLRFRSPALFFLGEGLEPSQFYFWEENQPNMLGTAFSEDASLMISGNVWVNVDESLGNLFNPTQSQARFLLQGNQASENWMVVTSENSSVTYNFVIHREPDVQNTSHTPRVYVSAKSDERRWPEDSGTNPFVIDSNPDYRIFVGGEVSSNGLGTFDFDDFGKVDWVTASVGTGETLALSSNLEKVSIFTSSSYSLLNLGEQSYKGEIVSSNLTFSQGDVSTTINFHDNRLAIQKEGTSLFAAYGAEGGNAPQVVFGKTVDDVLTSNYALMVFGEANFIPTTAFFITENTLHGDVSLPSVNIQTVNVSHHLMFMNFDNNGFLISAFGTAGNGWDFVTINNDSYINYPDVVAILPSANLAEATSVVSGLDLSDGSIFVSGNVSVNGRLSVNDTLRVRLVTVARTDNALPPHVTLLSQYSYEAPLHLYSVDTDLVYKLGALDSDTPVYKISPMSLLTNFQNLEKALSVGYMYDSTTDVGENQLQYIPFISYFQEFTSDSRLWENNVFDPQGVFHDRANMSTLNVQGYVVLDNQRTSSSVSSFGVPYTFTDRYAFRFGSEASSIVNSTLEAAADFDFFLGDARENPSSMYRVKQEIVSRSEMSTFLSGVYGLDIRIDGAESYTDIDQFGNPRTQGLSDVFSDSVSLNLRGLVVDLSGLNFSRQSEVVGLFPARTYSALFLGNIFIGSGLDHIPTFNSYSEAESSNLLVSGDIQVLSDINVDRLIVRDSLVFINPTDVEGIFIEDLSQGQVVDVRFLSGIQDPQYMLTVGGSNSRFSFGESVVKQQDVQTGLIVGDISSEERLALDPLFIYKRPKIVRYVKKDASMVLSKLYDEVSTQKEVLSHLVISSANVDVNQSLQLTRVSIQAPLENRVGGAGRKLYGVDIDFTDLVSHESTPLYGLRVDVPQLALPTVNAAIFKGAPVYINHSLDKVSADISLNIGGSIRSDFFAYEEASRNQESSVMFLDVTSLIVTSNDAFDAGFVAETVTVDQLKLVENLMIDQLPISSLEALSTKVSVEALNFPNGFLTGNALRVLNYDSVFTSFDTVSFSVTLLTVSQDLEVEALFVDHFYVPRMAISSNSGVTMSGFEGAVLSYHHDKFGFFTETPRSLLTLGGDRLNAYVVDDPDTWSVFRMELDAPEVATAGVGMYFSAQDMTGAELASASMFAKYDASNQLDFVFAVEGHDVMHVKDTGLIVSRSFTETSLPADLQVFGGLQVDGVFRKNRGDIQHLFVDQLSFLSVSLNFNQDRSFMTQTFSFDEADLRSFQGPFMGQFYSVHLPVLGLNQKAVVSNFHMNLGQYLSLDGRVKGLALELPISSVHSDSVIGLSLNVGTLPTQNAAIFMGGYVGVGVTSPSVALDVLGTLKVSGSISDLGSDVLSENVFSTLTMTAMQVSVNTVNAYFANDSVERILPSFVGNQTHVLGQTLQSVDAAYPNVFPLDITVRSGVTANATTNRLAAFTLPTLLENVQADVLAVPSMAIGVRDPDMTSANFILGLNGASASDTTEIMSELATRSRVLLISQNLVMNGFFVGDGVSISAPVTQNTYRFSTFDFSDDAEFLVTVNDAMVTGVLSAPYLPVQQVFDLDNTVLNSFAHINSHTLVYVDGDRQVYQLTSLGQPSFGMPFVWRNNSDVFTVSYNSVLFDERPTSKELIVSSSLVNRSVLQHFSDQDVSLMDVRVELPFQSAQAAIDLGDTLHTFVAFSMEASGNDVTENLYGLRVDMRGLASPNATHSAFTVDGNQTFSASSRIDSAYFMGDVAVLPSGNGLMTPIRGSAVSMATATSNPQLLLRGEGVTAQPLFQVSAIDRAVFSADFANLGMMISSYYQLQHLMNSLTFDLDQNGEEQADGIKDALLTTINEHITFMQVTNNSFGIVDSEGVLRSERSSLNVSEFQVEFRGYLTLFENDLEDLYRLVSDNVGHEIPVTKAYQLAQSIKEADFTRHMYGVVVGQPTASALFSIVPLPGRDQRYMDIYSSDGNELFTIDVTAGVRVHGDVHVPTFNMQNMSKPDELLVKVAGIEMERMVLTETLTDNMTEASFFENGFFKRGFKGELTSRFDPLHYQNTGAIARNYGFMDLRFSVEGSSVIPTASFGMKVDLSSLILDVENLAVPKKFSAVFQSSHVGTTFTSGKQIMKPRLLISPSDNVLPTVNRVKDYLAVTNSMFVLVPSMNPSDNAHVTQSRGISFIMPRAFRLIPEQNRRSMFGSGVYHQYDSNQASEYAWRINPFFEGQETLYALDTRYSNFRTYSGNDFINPSLQEARTAFGTEFGINFSDTDSSEYDTEVLSIIFDHAVEDFSFVFEKFVSGNTAGVEGMELPTRQVQVLRLGKEGFVHFGSGVTRNNQPELQQHEVSGDLRIATDNAVFFASSGSDFLYQMGLINDVFSLSLFPGSSEAPNLSFRSKDKDTLSFYSDTNLFETGYSGVRVGISDSDSFNPLALFHVSGISSSESNEFVMNIKGDGSPLAGGLVINHESTVAPTDQHIFSFMDFMVADAVSASVLGRIRLYTADQLGLTATSNKYVAYESQSGDYAEYLRKRNVLETIRPADVLGVVHGQVSLETKGASRYMVASTYPIVVGNWPGQALVSEYQMVAFLGQVPVRVRGDVRAGQWLVPSGLSDGCAVAVDPSFLRERFIVGQAWEGRRFKGEHQVNTLIGFDFARRYRYDSFSRFDKELKKLKAELEKSKKMYQQILSKQVKLTEL
ncbi:MAG: hypothetical protein VW378_06680 [bacterium]